MSSLISKECTVRLIFIFFFYFRYDFNEHIFSENCQYLADLSKLESERVNKWINEMNKLAQRPNHTYGYFDKLQFRPLIGINFARNFIQDVWVKVSI